MCCDQLDEHYRIMALNRKRQIDTLKIFNDNVSEIREDAEYKVEFFAGGRNMAIIVSLPAEFPLEKPILKVIPHIIHPWVNEQCEITRAPGLLNFSVVSDLGRVVQAIIREFRQSPPSFANGTGAGAEVSNHTPPTYGLPNINALNYCGMVMPSSTSSSTTTFSELSSLSKAELEKLLKSEDRQWDFLETLPQVISWNKDLEKMIKHTKKLADDNLSKEPELISLKSSVKEKQETVKNLKSVFDSLTIEHQTLSERYAPENIRESLRIAVSQSDSESEEIAEKFLNLDLDVENFLTRFISKRILFHTRRSKEEKLSSQLQELQRAGF